ncbi:MAG: YeeE/YedE family protein [Hyphomicrobiaceae bacterium]|nr:YeeE/YedE family protein [Hyphomicrobiaceae bacterium]
MFDLTHLISRFGEPGTAAILGLAVGLLFGVAAQQSQFCLRSATTAFWRGKPGSSFAVWLFAFCTALLGTQLLVLGGALDNGQVRQLSNAGTMSGAMIGGLLFGIGMVLARGCASRLLVLSATGNLRALVAGLVLTVVAQASLRGALSPLRQTVSSWWVVSPAERSVLLSIPSVLVIAFTVLVLAGAVWLARRSKLEWRGWVFGVGVGLAIVAGWGLTSLLASQAFDVVAVKSVSFSGPSADTLMALINSPVITPGFDIGLVPGVFAGSFLAAILTGQFKVQGFESGVGVPRYLAGATLMGFGSMLAGGCAVGAGVTGGSVLALTAWIALLAMWLGAGLTDWLIDREASPLKGWRLLQPLESASRA